jgi:hypothetical protein
MSITSKSPVEVAREALAVGSATFAEFSHRFSPKIYTQPQLFTCLVLKVFFKTDYRGIAKLFADLADLRQAVGLAKVPHFTTLQKAAQRLLLVPTVRRLLKSTLRRFYPRQKRIHRAAVDSSGFQAGHASSYYTKRKAENGKKTVVYKHFAKLEAVVDTASHFVLAACAGRGPQVDVHRFTTLLDNALDNVLLDSILADAGYDSEANHRHAREHCRVRSFIPAKIGRPTSKPPTGTHRRRMKQRLNKDYGSYGQRWQVETVFSMIKRRLDSRVAARSYWSRCRELLLLVVTHNVMILFCFIRFSTEHARPLFCGRQPR